MDNEFTRFEVARIIGARALQISMGAPLLAKPPKEEYNVLELAKMEFEKGKIPITVRRLVGEEPVLCAEIEEEPANEVDVVPVEDEEFEEELGEEEEKPVLPEDNFEEEPQ